MRLGSTVYQRMCGQMSQLSKGLSTFIADVWFLTLVQQRVVLQPLSGCEDLLAKLALNVPILFVFALIPKVSFVSHLVLDVVVEFRAVIFATVLVFAVSEHVLRQFLFGGKSRTAKPTDLPLAGVRGGGFWCCP